MGRNQKILIGAAGIAAGLLIGFVLPSGWIFVEDATSGRAGHASDGMKYACPMFCVIMEELPDDRRCPVCGMDLTPVSDKSTLNEQERRMVGLDVEAVRRVPLTRSVRVVGEVDYDETRVSRITTRVSGWLEHVWAETTWASVRKGQKLADIYSPELFAAQKEYLVAWEANRARRDATNEALEKAAEHRLILLGIDAADIAELKHKGAVQETLVLRAPRDGVIIERRAVQGESVKTGDRLYTVADLSRVWVQTEVFESDLAWIFPKQPVRLQVQGQAAELTGRVAFVDPVVDRKTRTARVRVEVDNPKRPDGTHLLRVGQRVDAWLDAAVDQLGKPVPPEQKLEAAPLAVPRSAVLSTGRRRVIYVLFSESMGRRDYELDPKDLPDIVFYQMVPVRIGPVATQSGSGIGRQYYPVLGVELSADERKELQLEDLTEGMVVVTRGNLLLDSQAQLSGKPSLLFPEGSRGPDPSADPHAGH